MACGHGCNDETLVADAELFGEGAGELAPQVGTADDDVVDGEDVFAESAFGGAGLDFVYPEGAGHGVDHFKVGVDRRVERFLAERVEDSFGDFGLLGEMQLHLGRNRPQRASREGYIDACYLPRSHLGLAFQLVEHAAYAHRGLFEVLDFAVAHAFLGIVAFHGKDVELVPFAGASDGSGYLGAANFDGGYVSCAVHIFLSGLRS